MDIMTMHLVYLKYILDCPLAWTPDFGNREFPILVQGFMDINTMHLVLFSTYVEVQKIFENMVLFAYLVPSWESGVCMVINFTIHITLIINWNKRLLIQIATKFNRSRSTDWHFQRAPTNNSKVLRQTAIGYPSDLKIQCSLYYHIIHPHSAKESLDPSPMGSEFHNLGTGHRNYGHNIAFSLSPLTVKHRIFFLIFIQFQYMANLV